jgi:DNA adenine methylase
MKPFLKWVGGKTQLLPKIRKQIPEGFDTYVEPFLGGGAVLLDAMPKNAIACDANEELVNAWEVVKQLPEELMAALDEHRHGEEYYYEVRSWDRDEKGLDLRTKVARASRFIFINKNGFNGLWRVNKDGHCNVPYARPPRVRLPAWDEIKAASDYLRRGVGLVHCQYFETLNYAKPGTFYYLDPPYAPKSETEDFTGYTTAGFSLAQHLELAEFCSQLKRRGAKFLLSNSDTPFTRELYQTYKFWIEPVAARRSVGCRADSRKRVGELLVSD